MRYRNERKTFRLSTEVVMILESMCDRYGMTQTQIVESAIIAYADSLKEATGNSSAIPGPGASRPATASAASSDIRQMTEKLEQLLKTVRAIGENTGHQLNLLNSLCENVAAPDLDTYCSATKEPSTWLKKSKQEHQDAIIAGRTRRMMQD